MIRGEVLQSGPDQSGHLEQRERGGGQQQISRLDEHGRTIGAFRQSSVARGAPMEWITSASAVIAERAAAEFIARHLTRAVRERGHASLAISGGRTPWGMFDQLAAQAVAWGAVHHTGRAEAVDWGWACSRALSTSRCAQHRDP